MLCFFSIIVLLLRSTQFDCKSNLLNVRAHKNWPKDLENDCGISYADRIIGGTNASLGQYPWLARIGYQSIFVILKRTHQVFPFHLSVFYCCVLSLVECFCISPVIGADRKQRKNFAFEKQNLIHPITQCYLVSLVLIDFVYFFYRIRTGWSEI